MEEEKKVSRQVGGGGSLRCNKRVFVEYVSAKKGANMAKEMSAGVSLYKLFMQMMPRGG